MQAVITDPVHATQLCNTPRSHPQKYFFGVLAYFNIEPLEELQTSPQHIYKDKSD